MRTTYHKCLTISLFLISFICSILILSACRKDTFFADDKRMYISKVDSIKLYPGQNRLKVALVISDPEIVNTKIFWNNRSQSVELGAAGKAGLNTVSTTIEDLEEGEYPFEIISYDARGNTSAPVSVTARIYGSQYHESLSGIAIKDSRYDNGATSVYWGEAEQGAVAVEVIYTDQTNVERTVKVPVSEKITRLENFKPGALESSVRYRTLFKPDSMAIDSFYTGYTTAKVITGSLKDLAQAKNIYFGSLISYGGWPYDGVVHDGSPNGAYSAFCAREFNVGQATWGPSRWRREGGSDFNAVNAVINWSRPRYDKVMAMLIVGPNNYMPSWFTSGTFTPQEMDVMLKSLITELMTSNDNKSKVDVWCVANELFNEDGTYRNMKWNAMGMEDDASELTGTEKVNLQHPVFVGKAFQYCREITNALLELRDYGIENDDPQNPYIFKYRAFRQLVKHLQKTNRPIDVVGIQAHVMIGKGTAVGTAVNMNADAPAQGYEGFTSALKNYKAMGLDVYLTELDIVSLLKNSQPQPWTPAQAEQQRTDYYNIVKAAIEGGVNFISLWGAKDNNDPGWRMNQSPLLLDINYNKKPAYFGIQKAFYEVNK